MASGCTWPWRFFERIPAELEQRAKELCEHLGGGLTVHIEHGGAERGTVQQTVLAEWVVHGNAGATR